MMLIGNPYAYFYWRRGGVCKKPDCSYCRAAWNSLWQRAFVSRAYEVYLANQRPLSVRYDEAFSKYAGK